MSESRTALPDASARPRDASLSSPRAGFTLPGLTADETRDRLAAEGPNLLPGSAPKSTVAIVRDVIAEPMFLMLLAAGAIYLALGDAAEALFLLGFVFVVVGITLTQERKTQRALESLRDLSAPRALVIRDGHEQRIAGHDVVRGDVLVPHEGDRIAADALLFDGQLEVDESLLTGEAVPVGWLREPACWRRLLRGWKSCGWPAGTCCARVRWPEPGTSMAIDAQ